MKKGSVLRDTFRNHALKWERQWAEEVYNSLSISLNNPSKILAVVSLETIELFKQRELSCHLFLIQSDKTQFRSTHRLMDSSSNAGEIIVFLYWPLQNSIGSLYFNTQFIRRISL